MSSHCQKHFWVLASTFLLQGLILTFIATSATGVAVAENTSVAVAENTGVAVAENTGVATNDSACAYCRCRPYWDYLPCWNGGYCATCLCFFRCAESLPTSDREISVSGFEVTTKNGATIVSAVYPNSPARQSGLRTGDTILAVNGFPVNSTSESPSHAPLDQSQSDIYLVRRAHQTLEVETNKIPWNEFFARATLPDGTWTDSTLLIDESPIPQHLYPYLSGLILQSSPDGLQVRRVIPRTPAYESGITAGDFIVSIDGQNTISTDLHLLSKAEGADYRATLQITFRRSFDYHTVTFDLRSTTEILDRFADSYDTRGPWTSDD